MWIPLHPETYILVLEGRYNYFIIFKELLAYLKEKKLELLLYVKHLHFIVSVWDMHFFTFLQD